jgi:hypothetical protein
MRTALSTEFCFPDKSDSIHPVLQNGPAACVGQRILPRNFEHAHSSNKTPGFDGFVETGGIQI